MRLNLVLVLLAASACVGEPAGDPTKVGPDPNSPRVQEGLAALYNFHEGEGLIVHDVSGVEPAFDLDLDNLVTNGWLPDGGIEIVAPSVITSPEVAEKLFVACVQANAVTLEVWAEPLDVTQSSVLFSYSKANNRNVTLSQNTTRYQASVMATTPDPMMAGMTTASLQTTQTPTNIASATAQHIVYTRDANGAALYVDGIDTKPPVTGTPPPPPPASALTDWSPAYQLVLGNESNGGKPWLGKIYLAAVYCRKLGPEEVAKNFSVGY